MQEAGVTLNPDKSSFGVSQANTEWT